MFVNILTNVCNIRLMYLLTFWIILCNGQRSQRMRVRRTGGELFWQKGETGLKEKEKNKHKENMLLLNYENDIKMYSYRMHVL